jgi:GLPGLI family protein
MKLLNKKKSVILFLLLTTFLTYAQKDFQGIAYYQTKTTMDLDSWGGRQLSEQQKKQMQERMRSFLEKQYILTFTQSESLYKEDEKLEAPGTGEGSRWGSMMSSFLSGPQYKNIKDKEFLQDQEFFGKQFLIKETLPELEWEMGTETKQIGQYMCFKATAVKKVDESDWSNMRRRGNNEEAKKKTDSTDTAEKSNGTTSEIELPNEINITAWYTPQIPVNNGPGEYGGLPGLILEVSAGRTTVLCTKIVLNPDEKQEIKKPTKGKEVSRVEYNQIVKEKTEEMREMRGGRGGGNRGH